MSDANDRLKSFLPSDDEIEKAMQEALRGDANTQGADLSVGRPFQTLRENTLAQGRVIAVQGDRVMVDLSSKAEGSVPLEEFGDAPPKPGDAIQAWVMTMEDADGQVALSVREAQRQQIWNTMGGSAAQGAILNGKVTEAVKGGCIVDVGVRAFMPARECDIRFVEDLSGLVGQHVQVRVLEADPKGQRVTVSRRSVLKDAREKAREALYETLAVGQKLRGTVTNILEFGAFVDLGGAEGLVHKGDLAWGRVEKVTDVVSLGDQVEVVVLKFDRVADKISLGLRQAGPSPWDHASLRYAPGSRVSGKVVGFLDFGALVELEPGIQGLVHVSEMSWGQRVRRPQDAVNLGDTVSAEVLALDPERRKLSLSMKKVEENPWASLEQRYPFASIVRGEITRLEDFGAFVRLDEDDVEGLVHVSEISWSARVRHPKDALSVGQKVTALVIGADGERQRLSLSIKKTEPDPWWDVEQRFPVGKHVPATVVRLADFGVFASVDKGLEGLIHASNLGEYRARPSDVVKIGNTITVEVLEVSEEAHRLALKLVQVTDEDD